MAKKFGKFLLFTAAVGTAAAAYYMYKQKKDAVCPVAEDDDYDDFSEDLDDDIESSRNYVSLKPEDSSTFTPLEQVAKSVEDVVENVEETVEEFFDEDESSDEEPPISDN